MIGCLQIIRLYLSEVGMQNLKSLYEKESGESSDVLLHTDILEKQLIIVRFQLLLFERRLKTGSFKLFLKELKIK